MQDYVKTQQRMRYIDVATPMFDAQEIFREIFSSKMVCIQLPNATPFGRRRLNRYCLRGLVLLPRVRIK